MNPTLRLPLVLSLAAVALHCSRKPAEPGHIANHIAVLRFENLTGDAAFDWVSRGAARQITSQLETSRTVRVTLADVTDAADQRRRAIVAGIPTILHGRLARAGERLRLTAELEDGAKKQFQPEWTAEGPASSGVIPLADAIAHKLDSSATPFGTANDAAFASYIAAISTPDASAAEAALDRAVSLDRKFASPYILLAGLARARNNRAGAALFLERARERQSVFSEVDRLRLEAEGAALQGDAEARRRALISLSAATPLDSALLRSLADADLGARRYSSALEFYKRAAVLEPRDPNVLNQLGYTQSYLGDLAGATVTLTAYERLHPQSANPADSMGEVYFNFGRFAEAEQHYRRCFQKNPGFQNGNALFKAAHSHLMTGDVAGASAVFAEYAAARKSAGDRAVPYWEAFWLYLSGKPKDAVARMNSLAAGEPGELTSLANAQLAVWLLDAGDRAGAAAHSSGLAPLYRLIAMPSAPAAAWEKRAAGAFPDPAQTVFRRRALSYALLLDGQFASAAALLEKTVAESPPSPADSSDVLLAWALIETGRMERAAPLLERFPVLSALGSAPLDALAYPRIFRLKQAVAEKKGDQAEAAKNKRIFEAISGAQIKE